MSRFDADFYRRYRPFYPEETFSGIREALRASEFQPPFPWADIGCGTGHSAVSILRAGVEARIIGVDPDPQMLEKARELAPEVEWKVGTGEDTGLPSASVVGVSVGSAYHWMNAGRAREEIARILIPGGVLCLFEYQFPKCESLPELNEWIRREFNLRWKAPNQTPRGDFTQVTRVFREDSRFELLSETQPRMVHELGVEEFAGLLFSQSRVLHYEAGFTPEERRAFHDDCRARMRQWMGEGRFACNFKLARVLFRFRPRDPSS